MYEIWTQMYRTIYVVVIVKFVLTGERQYSADDIITGNICLKIVILIIVPLLRNHYVVFCICILNSRRA